MLLYLSDQIRLHLAQDYLSFCLVAATAAMKLTEALESSTIYSTRISNESLVLGPSGQTFLRTHRAGYWFLTLHFIFIKWHRDLSVPKQTALSIPQFFLCLFLHVLPLLAPSRAFPIPPVLDSPLPSLPLIVWIIHTHLSPAYCNKNTNNPH